MMPSRGLQRLGRVTYQNGQAQCRYLSSASRRRPQPAPLAGLLTTIKSHRGQSPVFGVLLASQSTRHASTTPAPNTASQVTPAAPTAAPVESTSFPNLDTITLDNIDLSATEIAHATEKIGYLQEIGLNYGWGPSSMLQFVFEHVHIYTGLPWWGSIAVSAMMLRLLMFPLYLKASDSQARTQALVSITKPITDRMTAAKKAQDQQGVAIAYQQFLAVRKRAGIRFRDQFAPMIVQGVFGYCGFKLTRAMANLPVPALREDGFFWLQDMTLSDPYLILPVLMAGSIHLLMRMGGESGSADVSQMGQGMRHFMLWGMPAIIVATTGWLPGLTCVWFAAGGGIAIGQSLLLQRPAVREFFGIAPIYKPNPKEAGQNPFSAILESMQPASKTSPGSSPAEPAARTTAHTKPAWQAPNIRRSSSSQSPQSNGRVIDTNLVNSKSAQTSKSGSSINQDMVQPNAPAAGSPGIFQSASNAWNGIKQQARQQQSAENVAKREKEAFRKAADAYEKKASQQPKTRRRR